MQSCKEREHAHWLILEAKKTMCYFSLYQSAVAKGVYAVRALDRDFSVVVRYRDRYLKTFIYLMAGPEPESRFGLAVRR